MKLHEFMELEPHLSIVRVPGGWIYRDGRGEYQPENTFVPFNNEFMGLSKINNKTSEHPWGDDSVNI